MSNQNYPPPQGPGAGQAPPGHSQPQAPGAAQPYQAPGQPQAPGYPGAPQAPGYPGQPQAPGYPGAPQAPGYPGQPQAPGYPGQPQAPGYPGQPQAPGQQVAPQAMAPPANPYGSAQQALATGSTIMTWTRYGLLIFGGLLILSGVGEIFTWGLTYGMGSIIGGAVMIGVALFFLPQFARMLGGATGTVNELARKAQLAQTGLPATGRILQVQQTGTMINMQPEVLVMVEVQHPQQGVYQAQSKTVVPQIALPRCQPGAQVQVRINPQNPQDIALVF